MCNTITLSDVYTDLEIVCFDIIRVRSVTRFFVVYRPPHYDATAECYTKKLIECIKQYSAANRVNIIVGDLNFPKINWSSSSSPDDKINRLFLNLTIELGFTQFVNFGTNVCNNILDVILSDDDQISCQVASRPPLGNSDHSVMKFNVVLTAFNQSACVNCYNWYKADYESLHVYLSSIDWQALVCLNPSAISTWNAYTSVMRQAIDLFVPQHIVRQTPGCQKRQPRKMQKLARAKLKLWHKLKTRPYDSHVRTQYRKCVNMWRRLKSPTRYPNRRTYNSF